MLVMYSLFTLLNMLTISSKCILKQAMGLMGGTLAVSVMLLTETATVSLPDFALRAGGELITATTGLGELCNAAEVAGLPWPEGGG
jgi:hypothetical protein